MSKSHERWLLPDGVEEVLPPDGWRTEALRRRVLDLFQCWGYELVIPPPLEYLESLLIGTGGDLDLQTFKVTDQLTGRMMGLRADITSQAARIDAHRLRRDYPVRLCYAGTTFRARSAGVGGSRTPFVIGAELFGVAGPESDAEVICLLAETLRASGLAGFLIEIGHVGLFRSIVGSVGLTAADERRVFDAVQRKSTSDIAACVRTLGRDVGEETVGQLLALPTLMGGDNVLDEAGGLLRNGPQAALAAVETVRQVAHHVRQIDPGVDLRFDLAELRGYGYHTGAVFAAYCPDQGTAVAKGGRYDDIGASFGKARPATGFDLDLGRLFERVAPALPPERVFVARHANLADDQRARLWNKIESMRDKGVTVIVALTDTDRPEHHDCKREIRLKDDVWQVLDSETADG